MNPCIPDWNFDCDLPFNNPKKTSSTPNHELVELLWRDGQVVMQSQTHRRPAESQPLIEKESRPSNGSFGNSSILIQDDETISWIHYPVEDSFEKEFCSPFFTDPIETHKPILALPDPDGSMLPPRVQFPDPGPVQQTRAPTKVTNFSQFLGPIKGVDLMRQSNPNVRERSAMTVGSSHCGSNQVVLNDLDFSQGSSNGTGTAGFCSQLFVDDDDITKVVVPADEGGKVETTEPTLTTSSGGSGSSFGGTQKNNSSAGTSGSLKRKGRDIEDSECQSEAAELESGDGKKSSKRSGSTRRSRAAEVHNLSERRRRDRINKKMRALQELIPHCNKTDKASMLDEAIEYLKSLQLQLQMMWMGSGMAAPMMFPGINPYMSSMGMGIGSHPLANHVHNNMNMPRVPVVDHQSMSTAAGQSQNISALNAVNFQNPMQNQNMTEQFVRQMGLHQLQAAAAAAAASQPLNMFRFNPQTLQNPQMNAMPGTSMAQPGAGISTDDASSGKMS